jgi:cytochrome c-type biogenesis protein
MEEMNNISIGIAFLAVLPSFASPCFFPFIPGFLSYMLGMSLGEMRNRDKKELRRLVVIHSLFFIFGFTLIFVLLGLSATVLGGLISEYRYLLQRVGGVVIILFGLQMTGVLKFKFLAKKKKIELDKGNKARKYYKSMLTGCVFALAWTPCVGPVLSSILIFASTVDTMAKGALLLFVFSMGIGLPFFLSAVAVNFILTYFNKMGSLLKTISIVSGILIIIIGVLLVSDYLSKISQVLLKVF